MDRSVRLCAALLLVAATSLAGHPVLTSHDLPADTPLEGLYLLRGMDDPDQLAGAKILSTRGSASVARLDEGVAERIRFEGWVAVPLNEVSPAWSDKATRTWKRVEKSDPLIQSWIDQIDWTSITQDMATVMQVDTRHSFEPGCEEAADSLISYFQELGLSTVKHQFPLSYTETAFNVCGTQLGTLYPDSVFVICAHYDAISELPSVFTPGADDNASGVAAVLTAARFISRYPTEYTVKFTLFAGEEQGLIGSDFWTDAHVNGGTAILGALNFDMIGWWQESARRDLEVEVDPASLWLGQVTINAADLYAPDQNCLLHIDAGAWWGDHSSFWDDGFHAVNHEEAWDWGAPDFNPDYHTTDDLIENMDPGFTVDNVKIAVSALAMLVKPMGATSAPPPVLARARLIASPNPAGVSVAVTVEGLSEEAAKAMGPVAVQVLDLRGRVVDEVGAVDAATLVWRPDPARHPAGTYVLRLAGRSDVAPTRVSIVR